MNLKPYIKAWLFYEHRSHTAMFLHLVWYTFGEDNNLDMVKHSSTPNKPS